MEILVTGGCGFVGSHLVDGLVQAQHDVRVLDNLEYQVHAGKLPDYLNPRAEYVFGDVRDEDRLRRAIAGADVIFHQASAVGVGQSMYEIKKYTEANVTATANLLQILANESHNVKKLIVASSMSIYGEGAYLCSSDGVVHPKLRTEDQLLARDWGAKCPICQQTVEPLATNEDKPLRPNSIYAITKRDQEEMCLTIGRAYKLPTVALRYFNIYGPRQSLSNPYTGLAAIFSSRIKNDNPPLVFEDGLQSRDFIDVRDIARANMFVMDNQAADYDVFNVGTGKPTSVLEVARVLTALYNKELEPEVVNKYRFGDIRHCYADTSKLKSLGFEATIGFEEGMKHLAEWGNSTTALDRTDEAHKELEAKGLVKI